MHYRRLGSSDLQISEISLGSWLTYGGGVAREQAEACVAKAFELGINFIDTANVYARGAAESLLGEVLAGRPRDSYVLGTKLFFPMNGDQGLSREQVFKQLDLSLLRLKTEYVDLYQCHRYDHDTPLEETMEALTEVVRQGKVRYLGFSEWPADRIQAALELAGVEKFVSSQPQYSILWPEPERDVFPLCAANGISHIVWSPLAQGALTGKYRPGEAPPPGTRAASEDMAGRWTAFATTTCSQPCSSCARLRTGSASRWRSWRLPGCCAGRRWPARSSARAGRSRSRRTPPRRGSSSTTRRSPRSTTWSRLCSPRLRRPRRGRPRTPPRTRGSR